MLDQKEIAGWLREAADCFEMIGDEFLGERTLKEYSRKLRDRASQVESMRCVECMKSKGPSVNAVTFCNKFFVNVQHDHGCFAHEQNPAG